MHHKLVKYCRLFIGLTQRQLGEKAGVNHSLISKIEAGKVPVTKETEAKLMNVFSETEIDIQIIYHINNMINSYKKGDKLT